MIDTKKTIRNTTFIFIICILIIALFSLAPFIEGKISHRVFTVTIDDGVVDPYVIMVGEDSAVIKPEEPVRDGYKFVGWYLKDKEYDFSVYVTKDMTIKAIWEKEEEVKTHVIVTFDVVGGSLINSQRILIGGTASIPVNPTREGYTFIEWQVNGTKFDFGTILNEDTTIVALWREN